MTIWIGDSIIFIGLAFIALGVIGIFRFRNFYSRALISSKIDTVGFITIIAGLILKYGLNFNTLKLFLILVIYLMINPLTTHSIVKSAFLSGYRIKRR